MPLKVVSIVGARPQFVKAAVLSRALRARPDLRETLIHTGQHFDANMSEVFFQELAIPPPAYNLGIASGSHGAMTGRMLEALEKTLIEIAPDRVVIYGDTNSTLAGALAAAKLHLPLAHVEAGLRSFNRRMPEEINRVVADQLSDLLLVPTEAGEANLRREGIAAERIHQVGDVMYDATLFYGARASDRLLKQLGLAAKSYILATVHRQENTDDPARLAAIFDGLAKVAKTLPVVMPLHPRSRKALADAGRLGTLESRLRLIDPVGYLDMIALERGARLVATDSGGVQKEAFFAGTPCVTLREETEWVELVEIGVNRLLPPVDASSVANGLAKALAQPPVWPSVELYGGGRAGERIVDLLVASAR